MNDTSIIAYSLPNTTEFLVGTIDHIRTSQPGSISDYDFVMAPFDKKNLETYWFKFSSVSGSRVFSSPSNFNSSIVPTTRKEYDQAFNNILTSISNKSLDKVVLSRRIIIPRSSDDLYALFVNLKNMYPAAFTYLVSAPQTGTWIGASPELVASNSSSKLMTTAIAGTQAYSGTNLTEVVWGTKEIEEHGYIESFLQEVLSSDKIDFSISEKSTISAGGVCHIHSSIEIDSDISISKLAEVIHPGPALSGYPVRPAIDLINQEEQSPRDFYCGYLGPNISSGTEWYANIRCLQVHQANYTLYVGGGITIDSQVDEEWLETEMKSKTLLSVLELLPSL